MNNLVTKVFGDNSPDGLAKKSADVLDVFTTTLKKLAEINETALAERQKKEEERVKLNEEIINLSSLQDKNTKIMEKISAIIE